jgi:hypothetical protein
MIVRSDKMGDSDKYKKTETKVMGLGYSHDECHNHDHYCMHHRDHAYCDNHKCHHHHKKNDDSKDYNRIVNSIKVNCNSSHNQVTRPTGPIGPAGLTGLTRHTGPTGARGPTGDPGLTAQISLLMIFSIVAAGEILVINVFGYASAGVVIL